MNHLLKLAKFNKKGYPFSACIDYKNKLYFAVNEVISKNEPTAHAEIQAIRKVCQTNKTINLQGAKLFSSGEPCGMCLTAIAWANIKEVYYINSYKVANKQGYKFDGNSHKLNKYQKLGLKLKQLKG